MYHSALIMKLIYECITISVFSCALLLSGITGVSAQSLTEPLVYPYGVIGTGAPSFIWQDIYNTTEPAKGRHFRLSISPRGAAAAKPVIMLINPVVYYDNFFAFTLPQPLADGSYEYTIERLERGETVNGKYYHYLRYPIKKEFTVDSSRAGDIDRLTPDNRIRYLYGERRNILENGYNALFFAGSGIMSFGIGMLFYAVIDFGVISTIIYVVSFASSAVGLTASGVYGYRYFREKGRLQKILEIGPGAALRGGILDGRVQAEAELQF